MPTLIKNCGLSTIASIDQSVATGASFLGFVHAPASPRHLEIPEMMTLVAHARHSRAQSVAVLVDPSDETLGAIAHDVRPDFLQLHDVPSPSRFQQIWELYGIPLITAIAVHSKDDLLYAPTFEVVSTHLLFDAKHPGSGTPFEWNLLRGLNLHKPWFLAGGLTPENVANAIRLTHAPMVDVSSGIESAPGVKSLEKIAAFNAAVLSS